MNLAASSMKARQRATGTSPGGLVALSPCPWAACALLHDGGSFVLGVGPWRSGGIAGGDRHIAPQSLSDETRCKVRATIGGMR